MTVDRTPELDALDRAVKAAGGQNALARATGLRQSTIWNWITKIGRVPGEHVLLVERATQGAVTRHELRPDLYPRNDNPPPTPPAAAAQRVA